MSDKQPKYVSSLNAENHYYVSGPGEGLGYHSEELFPHLVCFDNRESIRAAKIANIAYKEGYKAAQRDIRESIGAKDDR